MTSQSDCFRINNFCLSKHSIKRAKNGTRYLHYVVDYIKDSLQVKKTTKT